MLMIEETVVDLKETWSKRTVKLGSLQFTTYFRNCEIIGNLPKCNRYRICKFSYISKTIDSICTKINRPGAFTDTNIGKKGKFPSVNFSKEDSIVRHFENKLTFVLNLFISSFLLFLLKNKRLRATL
jgi:hypothetical protein